MFCFHRYDKPIDRHQACKKCGAVRVVKCAHAWVNTGALKESFLGRTYSFKVQLTCKNCGEIKYKDSE